MATKASAAKNHPAESPIAWYGAMTSLQKKTFWAAFSGWVLNAVDFFLVVFAMPAITVALDLTRPQVMHVASATLVASAIGGWIAGILADRYGRARVLQWAILWFAVFGLLSACVQEYWQLITCRALMGLGLGGEWVAGAILLGEAINPKHRGKAVGAMQSGWAVGLAIVAVVAIFVMPKVRPDIAWRVMLCLTVLPALLVYFIRRNIEEPKVFVAMQKNLRRRKTRETDFLKIFSPAMLKTTAITTMLAAGAQGGYYTITWLLDFLRDNRRIADMGSSRYIISIIAGAFIGYLISAYLNDRLGRRPTFMLFSIGSAISVYVIVWLAANDHGIVFWGFMLSLFASGTFSGLGPTLTENFPTHLRGSGQGFAYNAGRVLAAGIPALLAILSTKASFNRLIDFIAISAYALVFIAAWLLKETNGKELSSKS
jgi:MFS family permease